MKTPRWMAIIAIALFVSPSCNIIDTGNEDEQEITFRLDGNQVTMNEVSGQIMDWTGIGGGTNVIIEGRSEISPTQYQTLNISMLFDGQITTGTFSLNDDGVQSTLVTYVDYNGISDYTYYLSTDDIGEITISEVDAEANRISGTFEFTLQFDSSTNPDSKPEEIEITNGVFEDLKL